VGRRKRSKSETIDWMLVAVNKAYRNRHFRHIETLIGKAKEIKSGSGFDTERFDTNQIEGLTQVNIGMKTYACVYNMYYHKIYYSPRTKVMIRVIRSNQLGSPDIVIIYKRKR